MKYSSSPLLILLGILVTLSATAQNPDIPRTEAGVPNLQGTYTYRTLTPLNRPPELADKEVLSEVEAAEWQAYENRRQNRDLIIDSVGGAGYPPGVISYNEFWYERGSETIADRRTSLVYDPPNGRVPALNAAGQERARIRAENRRLSYGPEARTLADRCLRSNGAGPPLVPGSYNNNIQIVQTADHVMILNEMVHRARIIPFADNHQPRNIRRWDGDSIARWDGDTLVISTRHFFHDDNPRGLSTDAVIEERITRLDANTLDYDFTVSDPRSWDVSWSARFPLRAISDPIYEYACHEGNHGLQGILAGWRRYEVEGLNGDGTAILAVQTMMSEISQSGGKALRNLLAAVPVLFFPACYIEPVAVGVWDIETEAGGAIESAVWTLSDPPALTIAGPRIIEADEVEFAGSRLSWSSTLAAAGNGADDVRVNFSGTIDGNRLMGTLYTQFGNFTVNGTRRPQE